MTNGMIAKIVACLKLDPVEQNRRRIISQARRRQHEVKQNALSKPNSRKNMEHEFRRYR